MKATLKISVIVPAYNVEKYLDDCVQSVLSQDYGNFELVLVDDGSTDSTPAICDKYAARDSRVRVVHQANGGRSEARNGALRVVTGDYVANLDGDDTYLPHALKNISDKIVQCQFPDLVLGRFSAYTVDDSFTAKDVELDETRIDGKTTSELLEYLQSIPFIYTQCRYIVKREMFEKFNLFFEKGLAHEDEYWTPQALCHAQSYAAVIPPFYSYRIHGGSFMTTRDFKKIMDKLWICKRLQKFQLQESDSVKKGFFQFRSESLAASALSEAMAYPFADIKKAAYECVPIYQNNPNLFHKFNSLNKFVRIFGCPRGIRMYARYVKFRQFLHL